LEEDGKAGKTIEGLVAAAAAGMQAHTPRRSSREMRGRAISHYKITQKLGQGGMGVVWKAEDTQLRRTVALKFLSSDTLEEQEVKARLIREAQAAASLDHPNICAVHGIHEEDGETFIAMAFIDGPSLAGKIKERPLPLEEALDIAIQIGEGLKEAHEKGIVHRDIKPANIMMTRKGQAKIMDFGLASLAGRSKLTKSGTTLGTPAYMAPEQLQAKQADHRADIWALGCALYEMLAQRTPFAAEYEQAIAYGILSEDPEPVTAVRSGIPVELDRVIAKALAKAPGERYQTVSDLMVDLRSLRKKLEPGHPTSRAPLRNRVLLSRLAGGCCKPGPPLTWAFLRWPLSLAGPKRLGWRGCRGL
jgi:serine/threonine protein kinase